MVLPVKAENQSQTQIFRLRQKLAGQQPGTHGGVAHKSSNYHGGLLQVLDT
jgi:hypothetical protein